MANYTEYFYEYIENGNEMPSIFDGVPSLNGVSFADMFKKTNSSMTVRTCGQDSEVTFFALGWVSKK